jgi:hypothetical protein
MLEVASKLDSVIYPLAFRIREKFFRKFQHKGSLISVASGGVLSTQNWADDRPTDDGRYDTGNVILHKAENDFKAAGRNIFATPDRLNAEKIRRGWDVSMENGLAVQKILGEYIQMIRAYRSANPNPQGLPDPFATAYLANNPQPAEPPFTDAYPRYLSKYQRARQARLAQQAHPIEDLEEEEGEENENENEEEADRFEQEFFVEE